MAFRRLTEEEAAVFDAIIDQRNSRDSHQNIMGFNDVNVFEYSLEKGQLFLNGKKQSASLGIGYDEQIEIIHTLANDGIINADWIAENKTGAKDFVLARGTDWAHKYIKDDPFTYTEEWLSDKACKKACFIKISFKEIRTISENCIPCFMVHLSLSDKSACLYFKYDEDEDDDEYYFPGFEDGGRAHKVIELAMKESPRKVNRLKLKSHGINESWDPIKSVVFDGNTTVNETLKQFIKLTADTIKIKKDQKVTLLELEALKKAAK